MAKRYSLDPDPREVENSIRAIIDSAVDKVKTDYGRKDQLSEIRLLTTVYLKRAYDLLSDARGHRFFLEGGKLRWELTGLSDEPMPSDAEVEAYWKPKKNENTTWEATVEAVANSSGEDEEE
jgi:hypothetical protein